MVSVLASDRNKLERGGIGGAQAIQGASTSVSQCLVTGDARACLAPNLRSVRHQVPTILEQFHRKHKLVERVRVLHACEHKFKAHTSYLIPQYALCFGEARTVYENCSERAAHVCVCVGCARQPKANVRKWASKWAVSLLAKRTSDELRYRKHRSCCTMHTQHKAHTQRADKQLRLFVLACLRGLLRFLPILPTNPDFRLVTYRFHPIMGVCTLLVKSGCC
jgi:hypothetical protein